MRLRIFSSVLLPAPLRPMMPTTSPRLISNETSFSAQNVSLRGRRSGFFRRASIVSASVMCFSWSCTIVYDLARPRMDMAMSPPLDDIREFPFHALEGYSADEQQRDRHGGGV